MSKVKEMLLSETDKSCAYCGTRDYRVLTIHHIDNSNKKRESYDNKIVLCHNCHHLHTEGKGVTDKEIRDIKKLLILKTLTPQGANALKEAYRKGRVSGTPYIVAHLVEMKLLEFGEQTSSYGSSTGPSMVTEVVFKITSEGKEFVEKWKLN